MAADDDAARQDLDRVGLPDPVEAVDPEDPYRSPIVIHGGRGAYLRLPISGNAVEELGGTVRLRERLTKIAESESSISGNATSATTAELTAHYDRFLRQLEATDQDYDPLHVDPTGGLALTIAVPQEVVERLGGRDELGARMASIIRTEVQVRSTGSATPSDKALAAHYDDFLGQIEMIIERHEG